MWHTPVNRAGPSSAYDDEVVDEERQSTSSAAAGSSSNNAPSTSSTASVRYKIQLPCIATPLIPQICSSVRIVEMSTNFQPSRIRNRNRRNSRRLLPYRRLYYPAYSNYRNIEEANFDFIEEPSYRDEFANNRMSPIPEDDHLLELAENEFSSDDRDFEVSNSIRGFSAPIDFESEPEGVLDNTEDETNDPDELFESANEYYMNHVAETLLGPVYKSNDARGQTLKSRRLLDPYQVGNESLNPYLRLINGLPSPTLGAQKLANNLIKLARYLKLPGLNDLHCLNCNRIPRLPVTGICGHSRCLRCTKLHSNCPCGATAPKKLTINTVVREITERITKCIKKPRISEPGSLARSSDIRKPVTKKGYQSGTAPRGVKYKISRNSATAIGGPKYSTRPREPITIQDHQRKGRELVAAGKFVESVPHLARAAASNLPFAHMARKLLAQSITVLSRGIELRTISRKLVQSVRDQSTHSWICPSDLECVICTSILKHPLATPCGHTYCRTCLERSMCYTRKCALCLSPLREFHLNETRDTLIVKSLLASIEVGNGSEETNVIPIVTCYVAFPGMPCPLFIFDPKYWQMVRSVTESGSRRFGMLAYEEGNTYADYGTVLEIRDCVVFEDNRCIISTIGVSRFRVAERFVRDECNMARVVIISDVYPADDEIPEIHLLDSHILSRALSWLKRMDKPVREEINTAFGAFPYYETPQSWWESPDGPHWLWWLTAILPLKPEIKILMISTCSLLKRMLAVSRTFDVMNVESDKRQYQTRRQPHESSTPGGTWRTYEFLSLN